MGVPTPCPLDPTLTLNCFPTIKSSSNSNSNSNSNSSSQKPVITVTMAVSNNISTCVAPTTTLTPNNNRRRRRRLPVLLFDVMDTIVRDPFYQDIPKFFGMSMKELLECKHPTTWIEFEKGLINEEELARNFFKDGRPLDLEGIDFVNVSKYSNILMIWCYIVLTHFGLKTCIQQGYSYLEGLEGLLHALKHNGYEMHAFTNFPIWYKMIEDKLKLSTYLSWTFCSCITGKRKPEPAFYLEALKYLAVEPSSCIFIDDRMKNVVAAKEVGMVGLQFKNAYTLRHDLSLLGIDVSSHVTSINEDLSDIAQEQLAYIS